MALSGAKQAVVADFNEAWREDVLQEAADELVRAHGAVLELLSGGLFIGESDVALFQFTQTVVAEGDAEDVRGEILESLGATAHRFGVDHPVLLPDALLDLSKQF